MSSVVSGWTVVSNVQCVAGPAGVMRSWAHFREVDLIPLDKEFDSENPAAAKTVRDRFCDCFGALFCQRCHLGRLPRIDIVPVLLLMSDRFAKDRLFAVSCRQHGDLIVKVDKGLDDQFACIAACLFSRLPGAVQIGFTPHNALPVSR